MTPMLSKGEIIRLGGDVFVDGQHLVNFPTFDQVVLKRKRNAPLTALDDFIYEFEPAENDYDWRHGLLSVILDTVANFRVELSRLKKDVGKHE